ncbi:MAG TPA: thiamine pyrophosphate-dependent enzyme [Gemmatimonadota bacterium]
MTDRRGADLVVEALVAEGVEVVFGHPGGAIMPIYDALFEGPIRHVLVRHEQGGVHAADGYARATGRVGVCMATSGPGATNLVTGLATAMMDSIPLVAITGQVPSRLIGTDAFQETDVIGLTYSVTKHSVQVRDPRRIGDELRRAFRIARGGRPGPVLVDLPKDVTLAAVPDVGVRSAKDTGGPATPSRRRAHAAQSNGSSNGFMPGGRNGGASRWNGVREVSSEASDRASLAPVGLPAQPRAAAAGRIAEERRAKPDPRDVEAALELLRAAERPLFLVGGGVKLAGAWREARELVRRTGIPAVSTLNGLGCLEPTDPLHFGMVGMHGLRACNLATHGCDVLFSLGARFDDRVTGRLDAFAPEAKTIHLDVDPAEIGKVRRADVAIVADAREALSALLEALPTPWPSACDEWLERMRAWEREGAGTLTPEAGTPTIDPRLLMRTVADALYEHDAAAIAVTDVGQHQMWAAQFLPIRHPRAFLTSGGLGAMGFGLPAALGAQIAFPGRTVLLVTGDGSLQMTSQEMITAVEYELPVKVVVVNNGFLGMVRQWQELFHGRRYSATALFNPDFAGLARAYGWAGSRVDARSGTAELRARLVACLEEPGPALLDCHVTAEANVYPMVPVGGANHEMLDEEPVVAAV